MIRLEIDSVKEIYVSICFQGSMFDRFQSAFREVTTFVQIENNGAVLRDWYSEDELEKDEQLEEWLDGSR